MNLPVELFNESRDKFLILKNNLASIFDDIGCFANSEESEQCFIKEILQPTRAELDYAFKEVLRIMKNNEQSREKIDNGIQKIFQLQDVIGKLLNKFQTIKTCINESFSEKDKSGSNSSSQSIKSSKINHLFIQIDEISDYNNDLIRNLDSLYKEFSKICESIDKTHKNYLNDVEKRIILSYKELTDELDDSSKYINTLLEHLNHVEDSILKIINYLQMEDIERQNLEKIIYFIEAMVNGYDDYYIRIGDSITHDKLEEVILFISNSKIVEVKGSFANIINDLDHCFEMVKHNISNFNKIFNNIDSYNNGNSKIIKFDNICRKMKLLEDDFVTHVNKIIEMIKSLNEFLYKIFTIKRKFSNFFAAISNIINEFEIIIKDSSDNIKSESDLKDLISDIKQTIDETMNLYKDIKYSVGSYIDMHHRNLMKQEEILQRCIFSIQKVYFKLNESRNHYKYISEEISKNSSDIFRFFENEEERLMSTREAGRVITFINERLEDSILSSHKKIENDASFYSSEIVSIKDNLAKTGKEGDYRNMMLVSLLTEYSGKKSSENVILF